MALDGEIERKLTDLASSKNLGRGMFFYPTEAELIKAEIDRLKAELKEAKERRGLVSSALLRQGIDPTKCTTNDAEINAISGKRFEEDL